MGNISPKTIFIDPIDDSANRASFCAAKELVDVITDKLFYTFLKNMSSRPADLPKRTSKTLIANKPRNIITNELSYLESDLDTVGTVHYRRSINTDHQTIQHKISKAKDAQNLELD